VSGSWQGLCTAVGATSGGLLSSLQAYVSSQSSSNRPAPAIPAPALLVAQTRTPACCERRGGIVRLWPNSSSPAIIDVAASSESPFGVIPA